MKNLFFIASTFLYVAVASAQSGNHDNHKAHVHGMAEMSVALDQNKLEIIFEAPADSIVGFEHKASTPEQKSSVEKARHILASPEKLFSFSEAVCKSIDTNIDMSTLENNKNTQKHSELTAIYQFECDDGGKLESISVDLFDHFSNIQTLRVMWITGQKQGALNLSKHSKSVRLK